jgi:HD-GYP domain-containing protein (c-di-GMP phosphodiesterase class II)
MNSISLVSSKFAFNSDNAHLNASVEKMRSLEIRTGDEIENLYNATLKMASDSVEQVEAIRQKSETITNMQNALILVLADIVESRDKNTGDHVRKTAAYARIIMKKMKEKGYYPEELTDRFIENVGNSAPMHDIGKIKVSDVILNKPGRLTDDEFVIMQTHAAYGKEIIDEVIRLVPESDYLHEAKNLAYYHHEKWNGKGYPEGIAGENIPLSARIMAVADVFDALVSKRSYKEPFSFQQAREIIREGAGSHFDPLVADAFLSAEEETRQVAESFGDFRLDYVEDNHVDDSGKLR